MVFKSIRGLWSGTAATCVVGVLGWLAVQDHPAFIPRLAAWARALREFIGAALRAPEEALYLLGSCLDASPSGSKARRITDGQPVRLACKRRTSGGDGRDVDRSGCVHGEQRADADRPVVSIAASVAVFSQWTSCLGRALYKATATSAGHAQYTSTMRSVCGPDVLMPELRWPS